jgi:hypothetical protein
MPFYDNSKSIGTDGSKLPAIEDNIMDHRDFFEKF